MTKEEFLALAESRFQALQDLKQQPDFYHYEKAFDTLWTDLGQTVLQHSIAKPPRDKRKKTSSEADTAS